jgi:hypothetical protein
MLQHICHDRPSWHPQSCLQSVLRALTAPEGGQGSQAGEAERQLPDIVSLQAEGGQGAKLRQPLRHHAAGRRRAAWRKRDGWAQSVQAGRRQ